ncbi:DMT family transporter [Planotetraspora mira]|jgi:DME family drug/metabolite transporter|uniref:Membrane protein n=1 Tax=Planotetraspora mira TaxID=58121 RepID=A0A8J3TL35_9ACTN|nr:EamA family transporter [Planotetraspora mira]GII27752.1 membrane protein [Planotetraspora mira]
MTRVHTLSVRQGFLHVLVAAIAWGTGGAAGALLTRTGDLGPAAVSFWRFAIGAALLVAVRRLGRRSRSGRTDWRDAAMAGPLMAVCQVAYFAAIDETGVALATMITMGASPVLVALGGRAFLREPLGRAEVAAVGLSVAGLLLMTGGGGTFSPAGVAWALLSAAAYAATTLLAKASAGDPYGRAVGGFCAGALCLIPVAAVSGLVPSHADLPVLAYLGAVPTALAYGLFFSGLTRVGATTASVVVLLEPLVAAVIGVAALGERPAPGQIAGGVLLLATVGLLARVQIRRR